jgi:hypothetical protein
VLPDLQAQEFVAGVRGRHLLWTAWTTDSPEHYVLVCADNPGFRVVVSKTELQEHAAA